MSETIELDDATLRGLFPGSDFSEEDGFSEHGNANGTVDPCHFRKVWGYSYVRFADGNVRFCDSASFFNNHKSIVDSYRHPIMPGDPLGGQKVPPVSAGIIKVRYGEWTIIEGGSTSAHLRRLPSDEKYIAKALGPKFTHVSDL